MNILLKILQLPRNFYIYKRYHIQVYHTSYTRDTMNFSAMNKQLTRFVPAIKKIDLKIKCYK